MDFQLPFPTITLTVLLLVAYTSATIWLLRAEARGHLVGLSLLTAGAAVLKLLWIYDLPPGLNEDEIKTLRQAMSAWGNSDMFLPGIEAPILHAVLFQLPIAESLQSLFWGSRTYPIVCSILSVPLAFVIGRSLQLSSRASYLLAFLVTVLPWSLFWSRLPWGGEIIFYQCLLVAAIARIIWRDGSWGDILVGVVGLTGLLWEYTGAWCMIGMPIIGLVIAPGFRRKTKCLGVLVGSILLWMPYILRAGHWVHYITEKVSSPSSGRSLQDFINHYHAQFMRSFEVFWAPTGITSWLSMHSVAIHPYLVLATAVLGLLSLAPRKILFILGGFSAGMFASVVSSATLPSTHRMMCAFLFISIASAGAMYRIERLLPGPRGKLFSGILTIAFAVSVSLSSLRIFLSKDFWRNAEGQIFVHGETLLSEALKPTVDLPAIVDGQIHLQVEVTKDRQLLSMLSYANWLPTAPREYGFNRQFEDLLPLYLEALPPEQVRAFGGRDYPKSFNAKFYAKDVAAWSTYGLTLTIDCKDGTQTRSFRVPTVMIQTILNGFGSYCRESHEYRYRATWVGPPTDLVLVHSPATSVVASASNAVKDGNRMKFSVKTGELVELAITFPNGTSSARLLVGEESATRLPSLKSFTP
jgi:hypothetical protein